MSNRAQLKPGDISLGQIHEWVGAFGRSGGTPDLLQVSIEDKEFMERLVYYWRSGGYEPTTDQKLARAIMPTGYYFGPEDWFTYFGNRVKFNKIQLAKVAEIPWSEEELKNPGIDQQHFLFLGVEEFDGGPLNLPKWNEVYPSREKHPRLFADWCLMGSFVKDVCQLRWYLMPVGVVNGLTNLIYQQQQAKLPGSYEVPNTVERIMANILFYLLNSRYLDQDLWARTRDKELSINRRINIRGYSQSGVCLNFLHDDARFDIGVAASLKFLNS